VRRLLLIPVLASGLSAQCVMCFRTAQAQNQARARVLNAGILVLGAPPLLILAGFVVYVVRRERSVRHSPPDSGTAG
jgi:hypothetical protein